jgi:predicted DCC family thiol-disulfide oxidoreductase YuxK
VSTPEDKPDRPLILYDGDCGFCRFWVARWRIVTRGALDFAPAQQEADRFPQITPEAAARAIQLVMPQGEVFSGAEAVFRTLANAPEERWKLALYRRLPGFRPLSEWVYALVARHRAFFSKLVTFSIGLDPEPASYDLSRWVFLRLLGLVYFIAFLSLRVQIMGLVGEHGILPASEALRFVWSRAGIGGYHLFPTLAWISSSDASLKLLTSGGAALGLLIMLGIGTGPALVLAWACYLSMMPIGRDFLAFQWDLLLVETGFLAIFLAPWRPLEAPWLKAAARPSGVVLWLLRWLLFRLMFLSGCVKLLSGDPAWRNLTALQYHYWTQPLPTPVAWYAAQLPAWFQKLSVVGVFAIELGAPILLLMPRRLRRLGALLIIALQLLIALTGNYAYFNLLTLALCLLALDDAVWRRLVPGRLAERIASERTKTATSAGRALRATVAAVLLVISVSEMLGTFGADVLVPGFVQDAVGWLSPFYLANSYGLFAVMTTSRVEIVIEGSNDGATWLPYEFKYKPGDLGRRPTWVAPCQPRLDWQMWFAALGSYHDNPWFASLLTRLLEGTPEVTALLARNPFPDAPPRYIRAMAYEYHFTDLATRRRTGNWWSRELKGTYFPIGSLRRR